MPHGGPDRRGRRQRQLPAVAEDRASGLVGSLLTTVTSLLGLLERRELPRHADTLIDRVYDRTGIRLLGLLDLGSALRDADDADWGVLNLLGLTNPIGSIAPNYVVWGSVAGWTSSYYVVWGTTIQSPAGQYVVWGNGDYDGEYVVWGSSVDPAGYRLARRERRASDPRLSRSRCRRAPRRRGRRLGRRRRRALASRSLVARARAGRVGRVLAADGRAAGASRSRFRRSTSLLSVSEVVRVHVRPALRPGGGRAHARARRPPALAVAPDDAPAQTLFNFANLALSVWLSGHAVLRCVRACSRSSTARRRRRRADRFRSPCWPRRTSSSTAA